jgi:hypothetical protein
MRLGLDFSLYPNYNRPFPRRKEKLGERDRGGLAINLAVIGTIE